MIKLSHTELQKLFRDVFNYADKYNNQEFNSEYWKSAVEDMREILNQHGDTKYAMELLSSCYNYFAEVWESEKK